MHYNPGLEHIESHNNRLESYVEDKVVWEKRHPSDGEKQMQEFLHNQNVEYQFKKVFYVKDRYGMISQYFVVDFYVPKKDVAISLGYKSFSEEDKYLYYKYERLAKKNPHMKFFHWRPSDFHSYCNMKSLVKEVK